MRGRIGLVAIVLTSLLAAVAFAQTRPTIEQLRQFIVTQNPQVRAAHVDQDRLTVRRLDVVDQNGVIRLTLAGSLPNAILDGVEYRRDVPGSGITIYDEHGNERGGFAYFEVPGGRVALAQDYPNGDAIGWRVNPDRSASFVINQAPAQVREPALDGALIPGVPAASRIRMTVAADGAPRIELADAQDRPRIRVGVSTEGYGMLEFLDADGRVVDTLAPEQHSAR